MSPRIEKEIKYRFKDRVVGSKRILIANIPEEDGTYPTFQEGETIGVTFRTGEEFPNKKFETKHVILDLTNAPSLQGKKELKQRKLNISREGKNWQDIGHYGDRVEHLIVDLERKIRPQEPLTPQIEDKGNIFTKLFRRRNSNHRE